MFKFIRNYIIFQYRAHQLMYFVATMEPTEREAQIKDFLAAR